MARAISFTKRSLITKANSTMVVATAVAAFVVVFALVAGRTLASQATYQNKVIGEKKKALTTLKNDLAARDDLVNAYRAFVGTGQNVLGGNPTGTGDRDGDNAKIVLDALPSKYDFPALATSLEKLITSQNLQIVAITGTDDEVAQATGPDNAAPAPVAIPFEVQVGGSYDSIKGLIDIFERSIRPIKVKTVELSGGESNMTATIKAETYYQPTKSLNITKKVVK